MKKKLLKQLYRVLNFIYPELEKIEIKKVNVNKRKLTKKEKILIVTLTLLPIFIGVMYIVFSIKIASIIFLISYLLFIVFKTIKEYKKNKKINFSISLNLLMILGIIFLIILHILN